MKNKIPDGTMYDIPPDGEPSEHLIAAIKYYSQSGKPLLYLARMRRVPYGFMIYVKTKYVK